MAKKKQTFEAVHRRMTESVKARAAEVEEMRQLVVRGLALAKAGKTREARAALRKAQALQKKLGLSSRKL